MRNDGRGEGQRGECVDTAGRTPANPRDSLPSGRKDREKENEWQLGNAAGLASNYWILRDIPGGRGALLAIRNLKHQKRRDRVPRQQPLFSAGCWDQAFDVLVYSK